MTDDLPNILCTDKERLRQVLISLIGNAVKFTFKGGITLGVELDSLDSKRIVFFVRDTGIGI